MPYALYGKRTEKWYNEDTKKWIEPDKTFRALDQHGIRVNRLEDAFVFATREDAQEFLDSHPHKENTEFQIRKIKW